MTFVAVVYITSQCGRYLVIMVGTLVTVVSEPNSHAGRVLYEFIYNSGVMKWITNCLIQYSGASLQAFMKFKLKNFGLRVQQCVFCASTSGHGFLTALLPNTPPEFYECNWQQLVSHDIFSRRRIYTHQLIGSYKLFLFLCPSMIQNVG